MSSPKGESREVLGFPKTEERKKTIIPPSPIESREQIMNGAIEQLKACLHADYSIPPGYSRATPTIEEEQGRALLMCRTNNIENAVMNMAIIKNAYFQNDANVQKIVDQQIETLNKIKKSDIPLNQQKAMAGYLTKEQKTILQSQLGTELKTRKRRRKKKDMPFVRGCIRTVCYLIDQSIREHGENKEVPVVHKHPIDPEKQERSFHYITLHFTDVEYRRIMRDYGLSEETKKRLSEKKQEKSFKHYCNKFLKDAVKNKIYQFSLPGEKQPAPAVSPDNSPKLIKIAVGWNTMQRILFESLEWNTIPDELASYSIKVGLKILKDRKKARYNADKLAQAGDIQL